MSWSLYSSMCFSKSTPRKVFQIHPQQNQRKFESLTPTHPGRRPLIDSIVIMYATEMTPDEGEESRDPYRSRRSCSEAEELRRMPFSPRVRNVKKRLSKQLSMCETKRDIAWERRRRQILKQGQRRQGLNELEELNLTDEDLHELKGCIELGFGFDEESGQILCNTLPALDLYLSVHRRAVASHASTLRTHVSSSALTELMDDQSSMLGASPKSPSYEPWNICSPGDDPQLVKTKLRHWAQAVGCSVRQSY